MAKKVKLSVYGMQIKRNGTESQDLNNLCEGKSLISIIQEYITEHIDEYENNTEDESLFAFTRIVQDDIMIEGRMAGNILSGIVKTGDYGVVSELVDANTMDTYTRTASQADVMPFGFCILVPMNSPYTCIMVLQSLGRYGMKLSMQKKLQSIIRSKDEELFVNLGPIMPREYIQTYFTQGILQKICMTRFEIPQDESERYGVNYGVNQTFEERVIHKPVGFLHRKRIELEEWRRGQRSATDIIQIDGFEYDNLKFVFKLGGVEKTINLDNVEKIVITEDITDRVVLEEGHPQFEPLKNIMIEIGRQYLAGIGQIPQE